MGEPEAPAPRGAADVYFLLVAASNLVTALVPSETACLASSPGRMRRTAVCTSREPKVFVLEKRQTLAASLPMRSFEAASMKALVPVTIIIAVVGVVATVMDMINKIGDQKGAPFGCSSN